MGRRPSVALRVAALADGTRTMRQIAEELNVGREYVSATLGRLGLRDQVKRVKGVSIKTIAHRRLALLRRAHDAMSRREPHGISEADWDRLLQDIGKEIG